MVRTAVEVVGGRVPGVRRRRRLARRRPRRSPGPPQEAGADGLLLLPPYLVEMPQAGLVAYTREVAEATDLPLIVYNRNNARYTEASAVEVAQIPNVVGFKDGTGDLDQRRPDRARGLRMRWRRRASRSSSSTACPPPRSPSRRTARSACTLYSSATFAFAPELALAFYQALESGNERTHRRAARATFFHPLVRLRDKVPGYAVSLIKAGVALEGLDAGPVRPPLIDADPRGCRAELRAIIAAGRAVLADALAAPAVA